MHERWRNFELSTSIETSSKDFKSRTSIRHSPLLTLDSTVSGRTQEAGWSFSPRHLLNGSVSFWQATLSTCMWA
jgi:hypothetical protein